MDDLTTRKGARMTEKQKNEPEGWWGGSCCCCCGRWLMLCQAWPGSPWCVTQSEHNNEIKTSMNGMNQTNMIRLWVLWGVIECTINSTCHTSQTPLLCWKSVCVTGHQGQCWTHPMCDNAKRPKKLLKTGFFACFANFGSCSLLPHPIICKTSLKLPIWAFWVSKFWLCHSHRLLVSNCHCHNCTRVSVVGNCWWFPKCLGRTWQNS